MACCGAGPGRRGPPPRAGRGRWAPACSRSASCMERRWAVTAVSGATASGSCSIPASRCRSCCWRRFSSACRTSSFSTPSSGCAATSAKGYARCVAAQAGVAIVLASCAPLTLFWYASFADYSAALLFNGLIFALASFAGQHLLRGYYRPLILRNPRHGPLLWTWLGLYIFIGIQMGWIMRPFVGAPAPQWNSSAAAANGRMPTSSSRG